MASREVIVISDDESVGKDNIAIASELELTQEQVLSAGRNIVALLSWWLKVINTAIVSAAMIYMLLKQWHSKEIGSVRLRVRIPVRSTF